MLLQFWCVDQSHHGSPKCAQVRLTQAPKALLAAVCDPRVPALLLTRAVQHVTALSRQPSAVRPSVLVRR